MLNHDFVLIAWHGQVHPRAGTPARQVHHPSQQCMRGYGHRAGGTHPTGMHTYYLICLSFCPYEGRGPMWPLPMMRWTSLNRVPLATICRPVQTVYLKTHPRPVLTSGGWWLLRKHVQSVQVGGMRPTGMLSCKITVFIFIYTSKYNYLVNVKGRSELSDLVEKFRIFWTSCSV